MVKTFRPKSLLDALQVRREYAATPFAGGTDLMVKLRAGAGALPGFCEPVLFLDGCDELRSIRVDTGRVEIGAMTTIAGLLSDPEMQPVFREALAGIGAPAIRNVATIGGNICNASPAADTLPFLYAVDARVRLRSIDGERVLPINEFINGPGQTALKSDELLVSVGYDVWSPDVYLCRKVGTRKANALTKVSFLGLAGVADGKVNRAAVVLGAVGPRVVRLSGVESMLIKTTSPNVTITPDLLPISPINDQRSTEQYRRRVAENLLSLFIDCIFRERQK